MYNYLATIFLTMFSSYALGQTKMSSNEITAFKNAVLKQAQQTTSIRADFEESKYVSVLKNASKASGHMLYKDDKMLWQYTSPKKNGMLFVGHKMTLKNDKGRKMNIDLNKNKKFQQLQSLMSGSYSGKLLDEKNFDIAYLKTSSSKIAVLTPKVSQMAKQIKEVQLTFDNSKPVVSEIKIVENTNDYSVIKLKNVKSNISISDSEFTF